MCSTIPPPSLKMIVGIPNAIASTAAFPKDSMPVDGKQNACIRLQVIANMKPEPCKYHTVTKAENVGKLLEPWEILAIAYHEQP